VSELVDPDEIERLVGCERPLLGHAGRLVDGTFYILHSKLCKDSGQDLRRCAYSLAMDKGPDPDVEWPQGPQFLAISVKTGKLFPTLPVKV
jgi:hypothetical protein